MKTASTVALGMVVLIAAYACFWFSICAVSGDRTGGSRTTYALLDLLDIGIMVGAVMLIAKLNRKQ